MPALIVNVADPPAVTLVGDRLAVAPDGAPDTDNDTDPADPLVTAVLIVDDPDAPWANDTDDGLALIEKSLLAGAVIVRLTDVAWVRLPSTPVAVSV